MNRQELINQASKYIKSTAYPNPNEFTRWYFKDNLSHAWCGVFIKYVIKHDLKCDMLDSCSNFAGCGAIYEWAKKMGYWDSNYKNAKKGDLVMFTWYPNNPNAYSHIGIVEDVLSNGIKSIDGNTSYKEYNANCVARKERNKSKIKGVIKLPYEEEIMPFKVGDYVYALEDIKLYTTIEYKKNEYTLKKGEKAYVRSIKGMNVALANPETHKYWPSAWTNELNKLSKEPPVEDYKKLYEEEVAKNKILQDKIDKAILDLQ